MKVIAASIVIIILLFVTKNVITSINGLVKNEGTTLKKLKEELNDEKKQTLFLEEQLTYVQSTEFLEKEARNKLNLTKKGEFIVLIPANRQEKNQQTEIKQKPIWKKWIEKFRKNN